MFIGHYGASLVAKRLRPELPLGALFVAAQFLDFIFCTLVLSGVEKVRIVPGFTAVNSYDLYFMPYSHSLAGAALCSALFGVASLAWLRERRSLAISAAVLAAVAFSHFLFDLPVHTHDLPLGFEPDSRRLGFGLWNHRFATIALELAVVVVSGALYLRGTTAPNARARNATLAFGALLVVLTVATPFMPDPPSGPFFAAQSLVAYVGLALAARAVDRLRSKTPVA
jgi:hypothetical protein